MSCEFLPSLKNANTCKTCGALFSEHSEHPEYRGYRAAGRKRVLTDAQERQIVEWYFSCRTARQKARELGVYVSTIHASLHRNRRIDGTVGKPRRLTPAQEQQLLEWHQSCRTVKQKAAELGVCTQPIYNAIARHDPSRRQCR